jgi:hypothetical protein
MKPEIAFCSLFGRVEGATRAWDEEISRRDLSPGIANPTSEA